MHPMMLLKRAAAVAAGNTITSAHLGSQQGHTHTRPDDAETLPTSSSSRHCQPQRTHIHFCFTLSTSAHLFLVPGQVQQHMHVRHTYISDAPDRHKAPHLHTCTATSRTRLMTRSSTSCIRHTPYIRSANTEAQVMITRHCIHRKRQLTWFRTRSSTSCPKRRTQGRLRPGVASSCSTDVGR